jgi:hypothetical protein
MVPLAEADEAGDDIRVPYAKAQVKHAPQVDADGKLTQDEEARLYDHYGLDYGEGGRTPDCPRARAGRRTTAVGTSAGTPAGPPPMTR